MPDCRLLCILVIVSICQMGCGRKGDGPETATVTGQVKLDGTPLAEGGISFMPSDGVGIPSGAKIVNGAYRAEVPLGEKRIEIRAPKVIGQKPAYDAPDSPKIDIIEEKVPARYNANSELKATVVKGSNTFDFPLETPK